MESSSETAPGLGDFELDPERHPPGLLRVFEEHRRRWARGEIRLSDHVEEMVDGPRGRRPLWYPKPLGLRVIVDKAELFDRIGYRPSEPACIAHASLAKIRVFSGGARAGKSLWGGHDVLPIVLSPDTRGWIVAPEYEQGRKEFEYILEEIETDEIRRGWDTFLKGGRIRNNPKNGDMEVRLRWGGGLESFVRVKSAARKTSLLSEELDFVMVVEASQIPEVVWSRYLQMRLSNRRGIALFPSSPDGTSASRSWFDRLYRQGLRGEPGVFAINADSRMNPIMDLRELAFWSHPARMSDEDFEEQVRGRGTPRHGRVFKTFSHDVHVAPFDRSWPSPDADRGRAFDFGFADPYVVLWIARQGEAFVVYREFYRRHVLTDQVVRHLAAVEGWETDEDENHRLSLLGPTGRLERMRLGSVSDWDAAERADLRRQGVPTRKAQKDIGAGIQTVEEYLRVLPNGRPRLYISPNCPNLIEELESYQWGPSGGPKTDQADHAIDALRYFLHTLAPIRRPRLEAYVV